MIEIIRFSVVETAYDRCRKIVSLNALEKLEFGNDGIPFQIASQLRSKKIT